MQAAPNETLSTHLNMFLLPLKSPSLHLQVLRVSWISPDFVLLTVRSTQITTTIDGGDWRLRRSGSNTNSTTNSPSRFSANSKTNLNRRSLHHQSNGSLHSADSQSSTSPAPSPLPRPATVNSTAPLQLNNNNHALQSPTSATNLANQSGTSSPTGLGKRWNSTGDFVTSPTNQASSPTLQSSRYATKSLLNLQSKNGINSLLKHGWVWMVNLFIRDVPPNMELPFPIYYCHPWT